MKKNITKYIIGIIVFSLLMLPFFALAQAESENLVPCGTEKHPKGTYSNKEGTATSSTQSEQFPVDVSGMVKNPCHFSDLLVMVNKLIDFILFKLSLPIAAIAFAYAGFLMVLSGGNSEKKQKAIAIIKRAGLGIVIAAGAWLIVNLLLSIVGYDGSWIGFTNVL